MEDPSTTTGPAAPHRAGDAGRAPWGPWGLLRPGLGTGPRTRKPWPSVVDLAPAAAVAAAQVVIAWVFSFHDDGARPFDLRAGALVAAAGLALVFRRPWPVPTYAAALVATAGYFALDYAGGPLFWAPLVAFLTTALSGRRLAAALELAVTYGVIVTLVSVAADGFPWVLAFGLAAWLIVLFAGTEFVRGRREQAADWERRRLEESRRQVTEERLRIARELHDVVAHNISLVNLQASVALHLIDQQPDQARTALATIKDASKEALVELRSVLGVLRQVDEPDDVTPDLDASTAGPDRQAPLELADGSTGAAPRAPVPGLARLGALVDQAGAAGVRIRVVTVAGEPRSLPAGLDLAAFRIVQEALTNTARHAAPTAAEVRLSYGADLEVEVVDEGRRPGARPPEGAAAGLGSGHGLVGMRERAEAAGGSLQAGPRPGGGWRVHATLPLPPAPPPGVRPSAPAATDDLTPEEEPTWPT